MDGLFPPQFCGIPSQCGVCLQCLNSLTTKLKREAGYLTLAQIPTWKCFDNTDQWFMISALSWVRFRFQAYSKSLIPIPIPSLLWKPDSNVWFRCLIPIPGPKSLIPTPIPIPGLLQMSDSGSDSSQKWNHSRIGIVHHWYWLCFHGSIAFKLFWQGCEHLLNMVMSCSPDPL